MTIQQNPFDISALSATSQFAEIAETMSEWQFSKTPWTFQHFQQMSQFAEIAETSMESLLELLNYQRVIFNLLDICWKCWNVNGVIAGIAALRVTL
jgi:hypothetical protein